jgi:sugar phosphate permease
MWLPYFLVNRINKPDLTGVLASLLDLGGVIGAVVCGWLGDKFGYKSPIIVVFLACSLPLLFLFQIGTESIFWLYFIVIPATGFFIAGASNIISSAIAADLAQNPDLQNKDEAMATVTGIVDGTGGIGAAIGVLIMGFLSEIDWLYVFLFMVFMGFFSIICIIHIAYREVKEYKKKKQQRVENY